MNIAVRFKNLEPSDALRDYANEKLSRLEKYFNGPVEASVTLSVEKFRHSAEVNLVGDRLTINGKEETEEMYAAIDMVADKLEAQIKKSKQKNRSHRDKGKTGDLSDDGPAQPPQVEIRAIEYKPMDVDEAILQMDLVTDHFLVFTNSRTGVVNVLYRKKDGNYGLIQPQA
ncbi:ribosome-associated translation inhibitor RaiA [Desulfosarcina sp. OttesenSCG-928-G10]|nr:ribosome-associated translation inhibitor RaiA [Desulfosarcina sp. OttesenSCG-928-G10]MDL2321094.1 ribosome-associated translation inhibitor RaiA [Desulfosarcina sp. OttesenSCG-928-B08]